MSKWNKNPNSSKAKRVRSKIKSFYYAPRNYKAEKRKERKQLKKNNRKELGTERGICIEVILKQWYDLFQLFLSLKKE